MDDNDAYDLPRSITIGWFMVAGCVLLALLL